MTTPDLTQKVIGFRQWEVHGTELHPIGVSHGKWEPGPQRAVCLKNTYMGGTCLPDPCIPVVQPYCECGFYALHELSEAHWSGDNLRGIVLGWGRMAIHNIGWRAQFVEIAALVYPKKADKGEMEWVDRIAKAYNVPTVPWESAESYAKEFGDYVPESLKPKSWTADERAADQKAERIWKAAKKTAVESIKNLGELREDRRVFNDLEQMIEQALKMINPEVPEAYAALYDIYVPDVGELLEGLNNGIVVDYIPKPEKPQAVDIDFTRGFELSISTNATVLWLSLKSPARP